MKKFLDSKVRKSLIPLNLQQFAGEDDDDKDKDDPDKDKDVAFTPEQQAKIDALMAKTIAKERAKREKEIEAAKTEAEKLAKLTADQKAEYERQKRDDDIAKREADITRRELRAQALESLAEKGLPKQLADILVFTDAESTSASLESVEKAFREAVEAGVNDRLKGDTPKGKGSNGGGPVNPWKKDTFNLTEQGRILTTNPELAKQLKAAAGVK